MSLKAALGPRRRGELPREKRARAISGSGGKAAVQSARAQQEQGSMESWFLTED